MISRLPALKPEEIMKENSFSFKMPSLHQLLVE